MRRRLARHRWDRGSRAPRPARTSRSRPSRARQRPKFLTRPLDLDRVATLTTLAPYGVRAARTRASGVGDVDADRLRVQDRLVQHRAARVGHRQPRARRPCMPTTAAGRSAPRRPPRGRRRSPEAPGAEDPRRMVGGGLVGLPRLVVAAPGEALLALARRPWCVPARAAGRSCARPARRPPAGRRRSRPCARAARPTPPAPRPRRAKAATSGTPSYAAANGSRAVNVEPSSACPRSAPSTTDEVGAAVAGARSCRPSARGERAGRGRRAR